MRINELSKKIITFFKEVKTEIKKVNWPTKKETLRYTLIVILVSIVTAIFLGGLDFVLTTLLNKLVF
jgi:preprotein translocase subunit SecE